MGVSRRTNLLPTTGRMPPYLENAREFGRAQIRLYGGLSGYILLHSLVRRVLGLRRLAPV
jgi:hypothetical protein